jgi:hypothetical protein
MVQHVQGTGFGHRRATWSIMSRQVWQRCLVFKESDLETELSMQVTGHEQPGMQKKNLDFVL